MRKLFILTIIAMLSMTACKQQEEMAGAGTPSSEESLDGWATGTVIDDYAADGCEILIKLDEAEGESALLNPAELDKKLSKPGTRLKFKFQSTRMPHPNDCGRGMLVILNAVEKM
ncbi:hypothetical protein [Sanyastnella coralliicola]|uniref:hypothetical protein n=1 Tax=Sanyastnella coralliicola TaxID=3069118 RepID=UPI0027BA6C02|nr:hypothetical protein [Longitalea sp. SCSIO 12813]